jgi:integrase
VLRYRVDGRDPLMTIGQWPTWSVEAARDEARSLAVRIDRGDDPLEDKRRRRDEPTVADLGEEWLVKHATGLRSERDIRGLVRHDLIPALGRLKVTDLKRRDVIEMVEAKAETAPRSAAKLLIYTRKLLTYAADREIIPVNPVANLKPGSIAVKGRRDPLRPKRRERILDHDELRTLWTNAETCGLHRLTALALKLVLVTGQRPGEVAGMHADEIDGRVWRIPASRRGKTETAHAVHLTDLALGILEAAAAERERLAKRRREPWGGFIFEARPGAPVTAHALSRAVARYAAALGTKNLPSRGGQWRPHDLRRTMRTGLSAARVRPDIAELCTGHVARICLS